MKSLLSVTLSILQDCGMQCGANPYRDCRTVTRRVKDEGESFLTITLPTFASALEKALADGYWSPALAPSFARGRGRCLPRFLGGFTDQIFDSVGALLLEPEVACIDAIRQVCRCVSKLFLVCSHERTRIAASGFLKLEQEMRSVEVSNKALSEAFAFASGVVWSELVIDGSFESFYDELVPRHGPGTTAEGLRGNAKFAFASWPLRLEREFPFSEFGVASLRNPDAEARVSGIPYLLPRNETPVKVCFVPKTAKKPRVIAIEPVAMQFMQQSLSDWIRPRIESRGRYTSGHVNFSDQSVNSNLAHQASKDGVLATLDMSDASDMVSCKHVATMLRSVPAFRRCVFACRSTRAVLPGGKSFPLRKFASMGSAMCFPVEAMVFFLTIVASRMVRSGKRLTAREVFRQSRDVYVYGDDLVVPANEAPSIVYDLEAFGFRVNSAKSFWTGKFRESCGKDYYDGVDVTPVYLRYGLPDDRRDVHGVVSLVSFANQCYWKGMWGTAKKLRELAEQLLGELPSVSVTTQALGWESFSNALSTHGWHTDYQRLKTRCIVPVPVRQADPIEGDAALLKCFRIVGNDVPVNLDHLLTSVRFGNLRLKRRWI